MDLFTTARRLETRIARTLDRAARRVGGTTERSPLEIVHAIAEAIEQEIVPVGRGRRVFPYNAVTVLLVAPSPAERARYEALFDTAPTLRDRVRERIRLSGAESSDVEVVASYVAQADPSWRTPDYHLELARVARAVEIVAAKEPARRHLGLTVTRGVAAESAYSLALARIDLGRGVEVRDATGRLLRTNHVAFTDGSDEITRSVSRRHAHVACDAAGAYRVHDDGSAQGTSVLRDGASIPVRTGARGVRLRDGDEIVLGEARLRVALAE
jgi:hypothetical protein